MNTTIALVRHGVTEWNYAGRVQGRSDIPLAPEGVRQAHALAERLAPESWDGVYSSPLKRAYETARIVAERAGLGQVTTDARLIERKMGAAEGMADIDLPLLWPGVPWERLPGMEPSEALVGRAEAALREIALRHPGGQVICVAHGSLIRHFLRSLGPLDSVHHRTTAITRVSFDGKRCTQEGAPDHRHMLLEGVEYSGEKGRITPEELEPLLPGQGALDAIVWGATAVESAWVDDRLVGFARAFTDGVRFGCIDLAVTLPGYERVRPVLLERLRSRYPGVSFA